MTTDPATDPRWRVAIHEAAHGYALWRYFGPAAVDALSIRRGVAHDGAAYGNNGPDYHRLRPLIDGTHALDGLDPEARLYVDRMLIFVVIGDEATDAFLPQLGRLPARPEYAPPDPAAVPSPAFGALGAATAARIVESEADADGLSDGEHAFLMAYDVVGMEANPYLIWIRAAACRIAVEGAPAIHALASVLLREEVIGGPEAVAILEARKEHNP